MPSAIKNKIELSNNLVHAILKGGPLSRQALNRLLIDGDPHDEENRKDVWKLTNILASLVHDRHVTYNEFQTYRALSQ